ncbi:TetR/AcrR family transcriptional regulator [Subtercola sp. YIM 133946]|uniref:TetR/AcrR family transcriptional regulator n=1 Tax=Subtercola sp. YIM 133946 TaxID=3118909 RepID=UPI002F952C77
MDARQRRTRDKLQRAVYELASARPVNEVTVSELAALAELNRSTFYEHASSPQTLLVQLLGDELDALRDRYLTGIRPADAGAAISDVTRAVLQHVDEHAAIYRLGLSEDSGAASLHALLSSHFEASIRLLVEQHSITIDDEAALPGLTDLAASYISNGTVGVITAWLDGPEPRSIDGVLQAYQRLLPEWWPRGGAH